MILNIYSFSASRNAIAQPVSLSPTDSLKLTITTKDGSTGKKPHQAYLSLHDTVTGLEDAYPFAVKENGKAKLEIVSAGRVLRSDFKCLY